jgi:hypothetical protein
MQTIVGDIWGLAAKIDAIVIPTNVGWRSDGRNVMGRGLARQAARRWPELPGDYGTFCRMHGRATPVALYPLPAGNKWCKMLLLFPVKPLDINKPHLSWFQPANAAYIEAHLMRLGEAPESGVLKDLDIAGGARVLVPSLGCGNGTLQEEQIVPMLHRYLTHPCFVHVRLSDGEGK